MARAQSSARRAIVEYAELLWYRGLVCGKSGNISVRLDDGTLLVTPSGVSLRALEPAAIVVTDAAGVPLGGVGRPTSELPLHIAAYSVRPDARCVIHTHPTYCVAWSKLGRLFALDTVGALESLGSIAWTPYAASGTPELAAVCAVAFAAPSDTILMERHGLSSLAVDLETAFASTDLAEQTARIEFAAQLLKHGARAVAASARADVESGGV